MAADVPSEIVPPHISATAVRDAIFCMAHHIARQLPNVTAGDVIVHYAKDHTGEPDMHLLAWVQGDAALPSTSSTDGE